MRGILIAAIMFVFSLVPESVFAAKCMLVTSYHQGYAWNDGLQRGVESVLNGKCNLKIFYMDTKRNTSTEHAKLMALKAKKIIEDFEPDVLIAADDNASRYLVSKYYKNASLPVVFCGVNWSVSKYGYPYNNVTGMIEVAPIQPLFEASRKVIGNFKRVFYLGANTFSEQKNSKRVQNVFRKQGIVTDVVLVSDAEEWKKMFIRGQSFDLIMLGGNAGIKGWYSNEMIRFVQDNTQRWSVTNHSWMTDYSMYAMTKIPEEQGEWAAEAALAIVKGLSPVKIPIRVNRKWQTYVNSVLLQKIDTDRKHIVFNGAIEVTDKSESK